MECDYPLFPCLIRPLRLFNDEIYTTSDLYILQRSEQKLFLLSHSKGLSFRVSGTPPLYFLQISVSLPTTSLLHHSVFRPT